MEPVVEPISICCLAVFAMLWVDNPVQDCEYADIVTARKVVSIDCRVITYIVMLIRVRAAGKKHVSKYFGAQ